MYDLVIRNGTVVDGTGLPKYRADVAVSGDRIAAIGRIAEKGKEEMDATGHVVTPGFIDGHTHMDAQVFWDPLGSCSCWHGVTTVVMGNCGFTLAPGSAKQRDLVINNIERAEDINRKAMEAAIRWDWTTFREYMDVVDQQPKAINYAANIGHSALRTYVMGERAFTEPATPDDIEAMRRELRDALQAGAVGFSTSRGLNHVTPDRTPVPSRIAEWDEVRALVAVLAPLWLPSLIVNAVPYHIVKAIGRAVTKPVMKGTTRVLSALVVFPLTWAVVILASGVDGWLQTLAVLAFLPLSGIVAVGVFERIVRAFRAWRGWQALRDRRALLGDILADRVRLVAAVEEAAARVPAGAERQPAA